MRFLLIWILGTLCPVALFAQIEQPRESKFKADYEQDLSVKHGFVKVDIGNVFPSYPSHGKYKKGTDRGYSISVSYDCQVKDSCNFTIGNAFTYASLDLCNFEQKKYAGDFWAYGFRVGHRNNLGRRFATTVVAEMGLAYLQSCHKVDGCRYRSMFSYYFGTEVSVIYKITRSCGIDLFWKTYGVGRNHYRHGNDDIPGDQFLVIAPQTLGLGFVYDF